jgi:hypothetical protein
MKDRNDKVRLLFYIFVALLTLRATLSIVSGQVESEIINLQVTEVDRTDFPTVRARVLASGAGSEAITDLSRLAVRENGAPIDSVTTATVPVGADLVLVIDANPDLLLFDDRSGLSRREKLAAGITRYAELFMNPAGLDRVSIIVPDETGVGAAYLVTDVSRPSDVAAAITGYDPVPPRVTPLNEMLSAAIDHLAAREDADRFGAVVLYTDGARLDRQLDYPALVAAAQSAGVPIFTVVLGAEASPDEISNVTDLSRPTNGQFIHMPQPEDADLIYRVLQDQSQQLEITYRSALRQSGPLEVSVSLGNQIVSAATDLFLASPEVTVELPRTTIRRAGSAPDTPLSLLQPAALPFTARIVWPDGQPRRLSNIVFLVNGIPQTLATPPVVDAAGQLPLVWDISNLDEGVYNLGVEVTDELGFRATAMPVAATLEISRPALPTPSPVPTRAPLVNLPASPEGILAPGLLALLVILAALGSGLLLIRKRRRAAQASEPLAEAPSPAPITRNTDSHVPLLEWLDTGGAVGERIELVANDVTLGREAESVDIIVDDPGVSRLHARVRRSASGEYWLYDEGSNSGTFLNYERLGLAPRRMQHGDIIQIGRVTLRFTLELPLPEDPDQNQGQGPS